MTQYRVIQKNFHKKLEEKLKETYQEEDSLLFFLELIESKSSRIYFMINIVLMIWLSQIVLFSNLNSIPKSIYLISPLLSKAPIQNIMPIEDGRCPEGYSKQVLGTLPNIRQFNLVARNITQWKKKNIEFCVQRITGSLIYGRCPKDTIKCNNICVEKHNECPLTGIRKIKSIEDKKYFESVWYKNEYPTFYYVHWRNQGRPIIGLWINVDSTCANKYFLHDNYLKVADFKKKIEEPCKDEGDLKNIWQGFDTIPFSEVLISNNYTPRERTPFYFRYLSTLGYFTMLNIDTENPYCKDVMTKASQLPQQLPKPIFPAIGNTLLITSLIFMIISVVWWILNGCGFKRGLIGLSIFVCVCELVTFAIMKKLYSSYMSIKVATQIQNCVRDVQALKHWQFGISNNQIFLVIVFCNTVYLLLFFVSFVLLRTLYRLT